MQMDSRMVRQPSLYFGMFVRDVVVRDQMHVECGGRLLADLAQEVHEFLMTVLCADA